MTLRDAWDDEADRWIEWVRTAGHDSYDRFHRRQLLSLLPPPGRLTIDVGCGEGRVSRDLDEIGHNVVGIEPSARLAAAAHNAATENATMVRADGASLPLPDCGADLVLAFMSPQDMDDPASFFVEASRVLEPGGRLHFTITHPINSGGGFEAAAEAEAAGRPNRNYIIGESYFASRRLNEIAERDGMTMRFASEHRPLESYSRWLESAGFVMERIRESQSTVPGSDWQRVPLFAHLTAVKPPVTELLDRRLFHITTQAHVDTLQSAGELRPPSLASEGFVHFSTARQVVGSTERHYADDAQLVLLELDPEELAADVRWPEVYPGERFPHLHGPINREAMVKVHQWRCADREHWPDA